MKTDLINSDISVLGKYAGEALDTTITNLNGMDITDEVIANVLDSDEYRRGIDNRWFIGYLGHPADPLCQEFQNACITLTDMELRDDGKVYAEFDLLNTPVGRIVKTMQDAGIVFGVSIRGAGDVVGGVVDPDTFMFRGFDLVAFPAYPDSVPEFTAIAASTDPAQRQKYQKVCAAVSADVENIMSSETVDTLKTMFAPNSDVYKSLEKRGEELKNEKTFNIDKQKLEAMTNMYLDSQAVVASQNKEIDKLKAQVRSAVYANKRRTSAIERITAAQMSDIQVSLDQITASRDAYKHKNASLTKKLEAVEKSNLIYKQRVEASQQKLTADSKHKDTIIASLKSDLSKTVTASREQERAASDLDVDNRKLSDGKRLCGNSVVSVHFFYKSTLL